MHGDFPARENRRQMLGCLGKGGFWREQLHGCAILDKQLHHALAQHGADENVGVQDEQLSGPRDAFCEGL